MFQSMDTPLESNPLIAYSLIGLIVQVSFFILMGSRFCSSASAASSADMCSVSSAESASSRVSPETPVPH